ncbi:MAG: hypothetical protein U1F05_03205 [Burkholderiales bacterium]
MKYLIDKATQQRIAQRIDNAVERVLSELTNHGGEEALTAVLGHALMQQSLVQDDLKVTFRYRQLNRQTEEPHAGADGGFIVRVSNSNTSVQKAALFQAKLLRGAVKVRQLTMTRREAGRLQHQTSEMLRQTDQSVAMFYTLKQIYIVDANDYNSMLSAGAQRPLSDKHRLITLGTYLGQWLPRCTKGDTSADLIQKISHQDGFKSRLTMDVVSSRPSIASSEDSSEAEWRGRNRRGSKP